MIFIAALIGVVTGHVVWLISQGRSRECGLRCAEFPRWCGAAFGCFAGLIAWMLSGQHFAGLTCVATASGLGIMAVTDFLELRVYDRVSMPVLAYTLVAASAQGRMADAVLGVLLYGGIALVLALLLEFGTADIVGVAILGAVFGVRAWGALYVFLVLLLCTAAVMVFIRRGEDLRRVHVPAFGAMFGCLLIGLTGAPIGWEAHVL